METDIAALQKEVKKLQERNDQIENFSRRQNLKIIGIPEQVEQGNPMTLMATFFHEVLGEKIDETLVLDRAHRGLTAKPQTNPPPNSRPPAPRPMIVRFHYYNDKEKILQVAREKGGELRFRGTKVHIFPDMSAELSRRRAAFAPVKSKLKRAGITYGLYHPAELRFTFDGQPRSFQSHEEADDFINKNITIPDTV